jgi:hypothetical protein
MQPGSLVAARRLDRLAGCRLKRSQEIAVISEAHGARLSIGP